MTIRAILPALALALVAATPLAAQPVESPTITIQGMGSVEVAPDIAIVTIGAEGRGANPADAIDGVSAAMARVVADARKAGIAAGDIGTAQVQLSPANERNTSSPNPPRSGYVAVNTAEIRVRDMGRVGAVLRDLVGSGANVLRGVGFSIAEPGPHLDEARRRAVTDARHKAEILAQAAGVRLGPIVEIVDSGGAMPMRSRGGLQRMSAEVPVEPGEVAVTANVQIRWRLEP